MLARMSSSRFPGKVISPFWDEKTLFEFIVERIKKCRNVDQIILATSSGDENSKLVSIAKSLNIEIFQGSLDNVFGRFKGAVEKFNLDIAVRINGDCPFVDTQLIDFCIDTALNRQADYTSTVLEETFPVGMHVEVLEKNVFKKIDEDKLSSSDKEHVTPFIYNNPEIFSQCSIFSNENFSKYRLTVDFEDDLKFCRKVWNVVKDQSSTNLPTMIWALKKLEKNGITNDLHKAQNLLRKILNDRVFRIPYI